MAIALVTAIIVITCLAVCIRQKRLRSAATGLTLNAAYNARHDHTGVNEESGTYSENNSASVFSYDYASIASQPVVPRNQQRPHSAEDISSTSPFALQMNVAYD